MSTAYDMPQPRTNAMSKNDVVDNLMYYFGPPVSPEKLKDYSEHHAQTYHFPDAFVGSNVKIRDTLNNLIVKSPQSWQTTVGLPFFQIEGVVVEWDEIRYDVRLMQRVPVRCRRLVPSCVSTVLTIRLTLVRSTKASAVARLRCAGTHRQPHPSLPRTSHYRVHPCTIRPYPRLATDIASVMITTGSTAIVSSATDWA